MDLREGESRNKRSTLNTHKEQAGGNGTRQIKEWIWEKEKAEIKEVPLSTRKEQAGF
jgi:hypothetical protein